MCTICKPVEIAPCFSHLPLGEDHFLHYGASTNFLKWSKYASRVPLYLVPACSCCDTVIYLSCHTYSHCAFLLCCIYKCWLSRVIVTWRDHYFSHVLFMWSFWQHAGSWFCNLWSSSFWLSLKENQNECFLIVIGEWDGTAMGSLKPCIKMHIILC